MNGQVDNRITLFGGIKDTFKAIFGNKLNNDQAVVNDLDEVDDWDVCVQNIKKDNNKNNKYNKDDIETIEALMRETANLKAKQAKKNRNKELVVKVNEKNISNKQAEKNRSQIVMTTGGVSKSENKNNIMMITHERDDKII